MVIYHERSSRDFIFAIIGMATTIRVSNSNEQICVSFIRGKKEAAYYLIVSEKEHICSADLQQAFDIINWLDAIAVRMHLNSVYKNVKVDVIDPHLFQKVLYNDKKFNYKLWK